MPPKVAINTAKAKHERFRSIQREHRDYFKYWRSGNWHFHNVTDRQPVWDKYRIPKPGSWGGLESKYEEVKPPKPLGDRVQLQRVSIVGEADQNTLLTGGGRARAENRTREKAKYLRPYEIRLNKLLGWGGNGLAVLFDIKEPNVAEAGWRKVVIKLDLNDPARGYFGVDDDREWHEVRNQGPAQILVIKRALSAPVD